MSGRCRASGIGRILLHYRRQNSSSARDTRHDEDDDAMCEAYSEYSPISARSFCPDDTDLGGLHPRAIRAQGAGPALLSQRVCRTPLQMRALRGQQEVVLRRCPARARGPGVRGPVPFSNFGCLDRHTDAAQFESGESLDSAWNWRAASSSVPPPKRATTITARQLLAASCSRWASKTSGDRRWQVVEHGRFGRGQVADHHGVRRPASRSADWPVIGGCRFSGLGPLARGAGGL
jgi:hypothetical protein